MKTEEIVRYLELVGEGIPSFYLENVVMHNLQSTHVKEQRANYEREQSRNK
jgi:hypothetical protein